MSRPDDGGLARAAGQVLRLARCPMLASRSVLHAAPGRATERVEIDGQLVAVKWRDDRRDDREALLYRGLSPAVLQALGAPRPLGAGRIGETHLLFLEWVEGVPADWGDPGHVRRAFGHLGRVHATTAARLARAEGLIATAEAWAELRPEPAGTDARGPEPLVLDPGDLHADNFLLRPDGGVCLLDFENMRVRERARALRQLRDDGAMPQGALANAALTAYWEAAGWAGDVAAFQRRLLADAPLRGR